MWEEFSWKFLSNTEMFHCNLKQRPSYRMLENSPKADRLVITSIQNHPLYLLFREHKCFIEFFKETRHMSRVMHTKKTPDTRIHTRDSNPNAPSPKFAAQRMAGQMATAVLIGRNKKCVHSCRRIPFSTLLAA